MNIVTLGWRVSSAPGAIDGYKPYCDPPHADAIEELYALLEEGVLRGSRGDALWTYSAQEESFVRCRAHLNLIDVDIRSILVPVAQRVDTDRTELEALFAHCSPEMIVEDARRLVRNNRLAVRAALLMDDTGRSMVDMVATVTCSVTGPGEANIISIGADRVRRAQKGLPGCSVTWKDRRLHIVVPGIPEGHPMSAWTAKNNERVDAVRRLLAGVLSD